MVRFVSQNKNFIMLMMLRYLQHIITTLQSIEHKFFVPGHSFMASDIDFSVIVKLKHRSDRIYNYVMWIYLCKRAREKDPFHFTEMTNDKIFDF